MKIFYADTKDYVYEVKAESEEQAKMALIKEGQTPLIIVPKKGNHLCKYCGGIATGPDEDRLCKECHEVFGHSFYSEL